MPFIADRVKETTTTSGTGTITLAGAVSGYRTFTSAFATGTVVPYCIIDGTAWETGYGTLATSSTLTRNFQASSTGSILSLSGGTSTVFVSLTGKSTHRLENKTAEVSVGLVDHERLLDIEYAPASAPSQTIKIAGKSRINYNSTFSNSGAGHSVAEIAWYTQTGTGNPNYAVCHESKWEGLNTTAVSISACYDAQIGGTGAITTHYGVNFRTLNFTGTMTNCFGVACAPGNGAGTITNWYGFFNDAPSGMTATNRWALYNVDSSARVYSAGPICDGSFQYATPSSGDTVNIGNFAATLLINASSAIDSLTINLPTAPGEGQPCTISTVNAIRSVTIASASTIIGNITDMTFGETITFRFYSGGPLWYKVAAGSLPDGISRGQATALQLGLNIP